MACSLQAQQNPPQGLALNMHRRGQLLLVQGSGGKPLQGYDRCAGEAEGGEGVILAPLDHACRQRQQAVAVPGIWIKIAGHRPQPPVDGGSGMMPPSSGASLPPPQ
jgi:hypothetical protein